VPAHVDRAGAVGQAPVVRNTIIDYATKKIISTREKRGHRGRGLAARDSACDKKR